MRRRRRALVHTDTVSKDIFVWSWDDGDVDRRGESYKMLFKSLDRPGHFDERDSVVSAMLGMARGGNSAAAEAILVYTKSKSGNDFFREIEEMMP